MLSLNLEVLLEVEVLSFFVHFVDAYYVAFFEANNEAIV